jgi:hypothetical protein
MSITKRWSHILLAVGTIAMVIGALDPMEGSIIILLGIGIVTLEAFLSKSQHRKLLCWSFVLAALGVAYLWIISAFGGFGGDTGRSLWWCLTFLPYPVGWFMGIAGVIKRYHEITGISIQPDQLKWFNLGVITTIIYYVFGFIFLKVEMHIYFCFFLVVLISIIGIVQFIRCRYGATRLLWVICGLLAIISRLIPVMMGVPHGLAAALVGIVLGSIFITAGLKIGKLEKKA